MTAIWLADQLGISRQAVSQYETGKQSPAPEVMRRIAEVMKLPIHRFLQPRRNGLEGATIFYRSMATATKGARLRAEQRFQWLREIESYLRRFVVFPEVKFPQFTDSDTPLTLSMDQAEEAAVALRRFWGLGDGPISNVLWLAENNGAVVARHELFAATLDAFSEWAETDLAPHIVLGADKGSAARSRFDVAHELGHLVLHRKVGRSVFNKQAIFKFMEMQADRFAGAFLLPAESFGDDFEPSLDALAALKSRWKTSIGVMVKRARHLGLISSKKERDMWVNIGRRGWRTKEPLDDHLEPEQPRFLRRAFDALVNSKLVPKHQIPFELALGAKDIEELVGLSEGYFEAAPPPPTLVIQQQPKQEQQEMPEVSDPEVWTIPFPKAQ